MILSSITDRCEFLPWDSAHFGRRIARLSAGSLNPSDAIEVLAWCQRESVDCLYYLANVDDQYAIDAATGAGFRLVDLRITLEWLVAKPVKPAIPPGYRLRNAEPSDAAELCALAAISHRNTRFAIDPGFGQGRSDALYAIWIEQSIQTANGGGVIIAETETGEMAGYVSCDHLDRDMCQIGLIAVAESHQGRSLGLNLVRASQEHAMQYDMQRVLVVTQGRNLIAHRMYEKAGFLMQKTELWFHHWSV